MEVTAETFRKCAVQLEEKVADSKVQEHCVWVVPAPFCAMWYISDPQYLEGDKEGTESGGERARKANVGFKSSKTKSRGDFRKH